MSKYDLIIVLGSQPDVKSWEFPKQVYDCLDLTIGLFNKQVAPAIVVSGDRALTLDYRGLKQPFRECDKMEDYLIKHGVPKDKIIKEGKSRDTISNLYYIKEEILIPRKARKILFVIAKFRIPRFKFLCNKILGEGYKISFQPISSAAGSSYNESLTSRVQSLFLEPMKSGDHKWLDGKFYSAWMYKYWEEYAKEKYQKAANKPPSQP